MEERIAEIENELAEIEANINGISELRVYNIGGTIRQLEITLNSNRNNLESNQYDKYVERLNTVKNRYNEIVRVRIYGQTARNNNNNKANTNVQDDIDKLMTNCDKLEKSFNQIMASLILETNIDLSLNDQIRGLDLELADIRKEAEQVIAEIDEFKKLYNNADFSMTAKEIKTIINEFKEKLKMIKNMQVDKYNARVEATNRRIVELKGMTDLNPEIAEMIANLVELNRCEAKIGNYTQTSYLKSINYEALVELNKRIADIDLKLGIKNNSTNNNLEDEMKHIEDEIIRIESLIKDEMTAEEIETINNDILMVANNINALRIKLENVKGTVEPAVYEEYLNRLNDAEADLAVLNSKLRKPINNDYKELLDRIKNVEEKYFYLDNMIDSLRGHIVESGLPVFEGKLDELNLQLDQIMTDAQQKHNEGKLDDVQYNNLVEEINRVKENINKSQDKLKEPEMVKEVDVFAFLNHQIDGLENAILALETQIAALGKPIKRDQRKQIDAAIAKIEAEIKLIEQQLELHKEENLEKYNATKERLEQVKEKLENISKQYRKKCPLLVRAKKSAKEFYKKHKKVVLIAAGLAAIALLHATVGPVIMPALMHGNLMIMNKVPTLRPFFMGVNNLLGGLINAKDINGIWTLANGVTINPYCASASLLKGIAISGLGTAALVTPVVVAIKELINKMNLADLKHKMSEGIKSGKDKVKETASKVKNATVNKASNVKETVKNKAGEVKENVKSRGSRIKANKEMLNRMKELLEKYKDSKMSLDDFALENNLSDIEKEYLETRIGGR